MLNLLFLSNRLQIDLNQCQFTFRLAQISPWKLLVTQQLIKAENTYSSPLDLMIFPGGISKNNFYTLSTGLSKVRSYRKEFEAQMPKY